jgi:hypothetical protein
MATCSNTLSMPSERSGRTRVPACPGARRGRAARARSGRVFRRGARVGAACRDPQTRLRAALRARAEKNATWEVQEVRGVGAYRLPRPAGGARPFVAHGTAAGAAGAGARPKLPESISAASNSSAPSPMSSALRFPVGFSEPAAASAALAASLSESAHEVADLFTPRTTRAFGNATPDNASAALRGARAREDRASSLGTITRDMPALRHSSRSANSLSKLSLKKLLPRHAAQHRSANHTVGKPYGCY